MQEQQSGSAVGADAIKTGVVNDDRFETIAADIHGFGQRHDVLTCTDRSCGNSAHGNSTAGKNFERNERAGDVYDGQGRPSPDGPDTSVNDPGIAAGNLYDISGAIEAHANGEPCSNPHCPRCSAVGDRTLQRDARIDTKGGSRSHGPRGKTGTKVCRVAGCGLTLCEHVRVRDGKKTGPKPKANSRTKTVAFKVRESSRAALQNPETAQLIDELGFAIQNGLTIDEARRRLGVATEAAA